MPGAHEIGAAISGPRITGRKIMDMRFFSEQGLFGGVAIRMVYKSTQKLEIGHVLPSLGVPRCVQREYLHGCSSMMLCICMCTPLRR